MHDAGIALADWVSISPPSSKWQLVLTRHVVRRKSAGNNCDSAATNNAGCGVQAPSANSYGPAFNAAGGGWYAMERTNSFIKVWFWSRGAGNVPSDVKNGATTVNTDNWVRRLVHRHQELGASSVDGLEADGRSRRARRLRSSRARAATWRTTLGRTT